MLAIRSRARPKTDWTAEKTLRTMPVRISKREVMRLEIPVATEDMVAVCGGVARDGWWWRGGVGSMVGLRGGGMERRRLQGG